MPGFLKIDEVLSYLNLKENMLAAEFGCGAAGFTLALARKLKKGRVYALDIQEEKLSALKGAMGKQNLSNVFTVLCDLEAPNGSTLDADSIDVVLIPNVLFQAENKHAIIEEAKRVLKSGAELLVIDWSKGGPLSSKEGMMHPDEVKKISDTLGFSFKKEFAAGDYHYALLFTK